MILAGGLGTRLASVQPDLPKAMVEVAGRPFLEFQLGLLRKNGVRDIVLCVGHLSERIESYFRDGSRFGVRISYSRETGELLGTGGALRQALPLLKPKFLLLYGDSYLEVDYQSIFSYFSQVDEPVLMTVFRNDNRWVKSNVIFRNGAVTVFDKKARDRGMTYLDYGLSVFSRDILDEMPARTPFSLDILYRRLAAAGRLAGLEVYRRFYEIGTPKGLEELRRYLEQQPDQHKR
ncbi:MAG: sugar phosphate nucleotidyltransferase [Candidatus Erginobacter occultus]|nr:sugar phosphate nucleotidyltransferase [Candidatus Erginobacter occultus]